MHAFRQGCNQQWELAGMNPAVLRQMMGHKSAAMTVRYTGNFHWLKSKPIFLSGMALKL